MPFLKHLLEKQAIILLKESYAYPLHRSQKKNVLIGIHLMQGRRATTRYGATRKRSTKRLKHTGNLFKKDLQLKGVC